jgi:hypothetical protein
MVVGCHWWICSSPFVIIAKMLFRDPFVMIAGNIQVAFIWDCLCRIKNVGFDISLIGKKVFDCPCRIIAMMIP